MKFRSISLVLALTAFALLPCVSHAASFTFAGSFNGGITATGNLTGDLISPGVYDIQSGDITLTGGPTVGTGALDPDPNGPGVAYTYQNPPNSGGANYTIDNLLMPGSTMPLDGNGLLFTVNDIPINLWFNGAGDAELFQGAYLSDQHGTVTFTPAVSVTPEPSSLVLLGTGFLGLANIARKRFTS